MRYGLLALSIAMLTGGGLAAQSALSISHSAHATLASEPHAEPGSSGGAYGSLPFTAARTQTTGLAAR
jgi:hypothetical protein